MKFRRFTVGGQLVAALIFLTTCQALAQKWPASQLFGATFQMPGRVESVLLPDSVHLAQWQDSMALFQALAIRAPETAQVDENNVQAFYGTMVSQVEQMFGLQNMNGSIGGSSEIRVDGLPGRSTTGNYDHPTMGKDNYYRYDMAISGDVLYIFTYFQVGSSYERELADRFFNSVKLPDDPRRQGFQTDNLMDENARLEPEKERFGFIRDPRLLVGVGILLLIGIVFLFLRRQQD